MGFVLITDGPLAIDEKAMRLSFGRGVSIAVRQHAPGGEKNPAKTREGAGSSIGPNAKGAGTTFGITHLRTVAPMWKSFRFLNHQSGPVAVDVTSKHPGAAPQQWGAVIPPFDLLARGRVKSSKRTAFGGRVGASRVMFAPVGGAWRFFTKRKGFTLKPQNYLEKALPDALNHVDVKWAKKTSGSFIGSATRREAA